MDYFIRFSMPETPEKTPFSSFFILTFAALSVI